MANLSGITSFLRLLIQNAFTFLELKGSIIRAFFEGNIVLTQILLLPIYAGDGGRAISLP